VFQASAASLGIGTTTEGLRLRSAADTNSSVLSLAPEGTSVIVLEDAGNNWYKVSYDSVEGYMSGDYLSIAKKVEDADLGHGMVTTEDNASLNVRREPDLNATRVGVLNAGTVVEINGFDNGWYKITYSSVTGYVLSDYLTITKDDVGTPAIPDYGKVVSTNGAALNMRSGPDTTYKRLATLPSGTVVKVLDSEDGWYKITYGSTTGYVMDDYLTATDEAPTPVPTSSGNSKPTTVGSTNKSTSTSNSTSKASTVSTVAVSTPVSSSGTGQKIASYAQRYLGTPYVYGGNGPGSFDCSGFTKYIYAQFGYSLNRTATGQLSNGVSVTKDQLQPGDLVFFRANTSKPVSHVGIYIGGGQFIHASTNNYQVRIDNLFSGYYSGVYVYGRHIA